MADGAKVDLQRREMSYDVKREVVSNQGRIELRSGQIVIFGRGPLDDLPEIRKPNKGEVIRAVALETPEDISGLSRAALMMKVDQGEGALWLQTLTPNNEVTLHHMGDSGYLNEKVEPDSDGIWTRVNDGPVIDIRTPSGLLVRLNNAGGVLGVKGRQEFRVEINPKSVVGE